jgi:hypothetical protein
MANKEGTPEKEKPLIGVGPKAFAHGLTKTTFIQYSTTMWDAKKKLKKECQSNIRSVLYIIT